MMEAGIEEARKDLGGIVDRARFKGEPAMITRTGKAAAVVVPVDFCEHGSDRRRVGGVVSKQRPRTRSVRGHQGR